MGALGINVHVVTPYRPNLDVAPTDNPIYGACKTNPRVVLHSVDVLVSRIQDQYEIDAMDVWDSTGSKDAPQVCKPRLFAPLVHFLVDELSSSARTHIVLYAPHHTDLYKDSHALPRTSEQWIVYDGVNVPRACFPALQCSDDRPPYIGQKLTFVVNITASADPWWVDYVATAVRLVQEDSSVVVLCDMTRDGMDGLIFPSGVQVEHCANETDKCAWYAKAFACVHMGQGEDDQALLDVIGHGVPVIVNRSTHHVQLLGRAYPLFALRPDIQSIRKCVDRVLSSPEMHHESTVYIRNLQMTRFSYDIATRNIKRQLGIRTNTFL